MQAYFNEREEYGAYEQIKIQRISVDEFNGGLKLKAVTEKGCFVIILDDVKEQSRFCELMQKAMEKAIVTHLTKALEEMSRNMSSEPTLDIDSEFNC